MKIPRGNVVDAHDGSWSIEFGCHEYVDESKSEKIVCPHMRKVDFCGETLYEFDAMVIPAEYGHSEVVMCLWCVKEALAGLERREGP